MSLVEACVSTVVGFGVALAAQFVIFPWYGIHIDVEQNIEIVIWFTVLAIVRQYFFRRIFNFITHRFTCN